MVKVSSVSAGSLEQDLRAIAADRGKIIAVVPARYRREGDDLVVNRYTIVSGHREPRPEPPAEPDVE